MVESAMSDSGERGDGTSQIDVGEDDRSSLLRKEERGLETDTRSGSLCDSEISCPSLRERGPRARRARTVMMATWRGAQAVSIVLSTLIKEGRADFVGETRHGWVR